jgi:hypothetical protein
MCHVSCVVSGDVRRLSYMTHDTSHPWTEHAYMHKDLGCRFVNAGFGVQGCRVAGAKGFSDWCLGFGVWGSKVQGCGC